VCRALDLRDSRLVAIKVLHPELAKAMGGRRFLREIAILGQFAHANILPLLDSGELELLPGLDVPWYATPYVEDESLRARLIREGRLPVSTALRYTQDICAALDYAHSLGYVHRDIKPENILLGQKGALLADFGIARAVCVAGGDRLSSTGLIIGTPAYMSPEQATATGRLDGRSDLYSLAVVLYEMLAGDPPFPGATPRSVAAKHQAEAPLPIRVVRPDLPAELDVTIAKGLAKRPRDRFATARVFAAALQTVIPPGRGTRMTRR
jgi:serine/threonine-protein kinase